MNVSNWLAAIALTFMASSSFAGANMKSFVKLLNSPDYGSIFLNYDYVGEPMISPARLEMRIFCKGQVEAAKVIKLDICSLDSYKFDKDVGELSISVTRGFLYGASQVKCVTDEQSEIVVAKICRENKKK